MIAKLIQSLFPEGQRKVMVSLVAILIGTILEKFGGGLSDHMMTLLIAGVGIFTTGNVIQGVADAIKGTKVGKMIEDILPGDQGLGAQAPVAGAQVQAAQAPDLRQELYGAMNEVGKRFEEQGKSLATLNQQLQVQAQNTAKLVAFVNSKVSPPAPAARPAQPQRPPAVGPGSMEDDE